MNLPVLKFGQNWGQYDKQTNEEFCAKLEALGNVIMEGKIEPSKIARRLRVSVKEVRTLMSSTEAKLYIEKMTRERALYAVAIAIPSMREIAKKDPVAFARLAEIAELKSSGGIAINNVVDQRNMGDNESDQRFFERFRERVLNNMQSKMALVEESVEDPKPVEIEEPTD